MGRTRDGPRFRGASTQAPHDREAPVSLKGESLKRESETRVRNSGQKLGKTWAKLQRGSRVRAEFLSHTCQALELSAAAREPGLVLSADRFVLAWPNFPE
jgi:hypothetical protein